jgi:hypothetical protein
LHLGFLTDLDEDGVFLGRIHFQIVRQVRVNVVGVGRFAVGDATVDFTVNSSFWKKGWGNQKNAQILEKVAKTVSSPKKPKYQHQN